jgi:hypothetical protein
MLGALSAHRPDGARSVVTGNPFIYEINTWVWLDVLDVVWKRSRRPETSSQELRPEPGS